MFSALEKYRPQMLSILRIFVALLYLQAGLSKYFGWPAPQPKDFTMFSLLGAAGAIETAGSLLLLVGLWTREAAFIMSGEMAVAYLLRGGQVLGPGAHGCEQGDLVVVAAAGAAAARQVEEVARDVVLAEHAGADRLHDVAGLGERALASVDEDAGALHHLVVGLAHLRRAAADEIDVGP